MLNKVSGHLQSSILYLLHRAAQRADELFQSKFNDTDLTPRQYLVLSAVWKNRGASQSELVEITGIDRSTIAGIVDRMLQKSLLERHRSSTDGRAYSIYLSEDGSKILRRSLSLAQRVEDHVLKSLAPQQRESFIRALDLVIGDLDPPPRPQKTR